MTRVKICGITSETDARAAVEAGADLIGLVFAKSPRRLAIEPARKIARCARDAAGVAGRGVDIVGVFVNPTADEAREIAAAVPLDVIQLHGDESPEFCRKLGRRVIKRVRVAPMQPADPAGRMSGETPDPPLGRSVNEGVSGETPDPPLRSIMPDESSGETPDPPLSRCGEPMAGKRQPRVGRASRPSASRAKQDAAPADLRQRMTAYDVEALLLDPGAGSGQVFDWSLVAAMGELAGRVFVSGGLTPENVADAVAVARPLGVDVSSGVEVKPGCKDHEKMREFVRRVRETDVGTT